MDRATRKETTAMHKELDQLHLTDTTQTTAWTYFQEHMKHFRNKPYVGHKSMFNTAMETEIIPSNFFIIMS